VEHEVAVGQDKDVTNKKKPVGPGAGRRQGRASVRAIPEQRRAWLGVGVVVVVAAFLYMPAMNHQFTNWDDDRQITANPDIRDLSPQGIEKIFSSFYLRLYQPLTSLGFAVEYRLFGLNPHVYHTVNILLHLVNILLVFVLVRSLAQNAGIGLAAAALFAVHPLQVEVAAWASSLGIVLCTAFYVGTLIVYIAYVRSGRIRYYVGALALFVPALLAKTWAVSLPLVLLVIDLYLQRRYLRAIDAREDGESVGAAAFPPRRWASGREVLGTIRTRTAHFCRRLNGWVIGEKIPFFLLAFVFGCITMVARSGVSHIQDFALKFSLVQRICIVCYSCLWYVGKLVLPVHLSVFYPFPEKPNGWLPVVYYLAPVLLVGLAVAIWYAGRYRRLLAFTALFMLASLLLVVQIVPISYLMVCDRYAYIPCIALFFLAATLGHQIAARGSLWRGAVLAGTMVVLVLLSGATYRRVGVWRDSTTLWNDVIRRRQDIWTAYLNRGLAEFEKGDREAAVADFNATLALNPKSDKALNNRAVCYTYEGDQTAALRDFDEAIRLNPADSSYRVNRGVLKRDMGDLAGALRDFDAALKSGPPSAKVLCDRGDTYWKRGDWPRAAADYEAALRADPGFARAALSLGAALVETGNYPRAITMLNKGLALGYQDAAPAYALLARAYQATGRSDLANEALRRARELGNPGAQTPRKQDSQRR
jgi:tetratricopeptide (TPR) repeat protein